jgi:hypothetical protein
MGKYMVGDIIINEIHQQFLVEKDGTLRLMSNGADPFKDFKLVASTFRESGDVEYEEVKSEPALRIDLTSFTSEVEDDMFLKDIVAEEMKSNMLQFNSIEFMSKTGMLMHNTHGSI